jgi:universal stress protein E
MIGLRQSILVTGGAGFRQQFMRPSVWQGISGKINGYRISHRCINGSMKLVSARKIERILVAVADPSAGLNKAVRRARELAHKTGACIELVNAMPSAVSAGIARAESERFTRLEAAENHRLLERTANRLRREEIIVSTHVETGYPVHEAILRQIRATNADLLVIEARKHSLFARLLLTQTDFEFIRRCPVPLWIVKGRAAWRRPRILAALDPFHANNKPGELDREIVAAASAVAAAVGGSVHAAHIYPPVLRLIPGMEFNPAVFVAIPAQERAYRAAVRRQFDDILSRYGISRKRGHLLRGEPATEIPIVARAMRAGLVVMGAMSRSGLKRIFIGNTAERVLDSLQCDVLIVKAPSRR